MSKIIRTKTEVKGGITKAEQIKLKAHAELWIERIMRTEPIDSTKIVPAIEGIYKVSGLQKPKVIIVPSPLVMMVASSFAAVLLGQKATDDATYAATHDATDAAIRDATSAATDAATYAATDAAKQELWIQILASEFANGNTDLERQLLNNCANWYKAYQGGNMWGQYDSYLTAMRDVLGLDLPVFEKYKYWEDAAIHGGFRTMMPTFCMVSDFPEFIRQHAVTKQPHCEYGASHRWRDGWELFHLYGIRFDKEMYWKVINQEMSFADILNISDMDKRMVAMRYCKPYKLFEGTKAELVFAKSEKGNELWKIPASSGVFTRDEYFLHYFCPSSNREYLKGVHPDKVVKFKYNGDALMADSHHFTLEQYMDKNFISR